VEDKTLTTRKIIRDTDQRGIWEVKRHPVPGEKPFATWQSLTLREVTEEKSEA